MSSSAKAYRRHRVIAGASAGTMPSAELATRAAEPAGPPAVAVDPLEVARRQGAEEGRRAVLAELAELEGHSLADAAHRLADAAAVAAQVRQSVVDEVTSDALDLVVELLGVLVDHEISLSALPERDALRRAMKLAPAGTDLVVRVHPGAQLGPAEIGLTATGANVSVIEDPSVEPGSCVVEIGSCRIDAQVESALARVRQVLAALRADGDKDKAVPA
ncbi:MAG TPA: FliH/SctL family protein [Acidimicrobiales bacterium]|nr:FliH/SctL family protein [Acidimicrobiales bacterium]